MIPKTIEHGIEPEKGGSEWHSRTEPSTGPYREQLFQSVDGTVGTFRAANKPRHSRIPGQASVKKRCEPLIVRLEERQ
jgi:hypothetical protein